MKAAMYYGNKDIRIEDIPEPAVRPGTVKVKIEWCGICGTDLHEYLDGPIFAPPAGAPHPLTGETVPVCLGHEFAGIVADVGDGVTNVAVGERVVVEPYITSERAPAARPASTTSATRWASSACPGVAVASPTTSWPTPSARFPSGTWAPTSAR